MNDQQAFDKMVTHLFTQKEQALDVKEISLAPDCFYRMPCGKMCAVGALIPDEEYESSFEGEDVLSIQSQVSTLKVLDSNLLYLMQGIHDNTVPEEWFIEIEDLADTLGLDKTILAQYENTL